jgi:hypothetical protein
MLGFNIRNDGSARRAEVTLATDPALFAPENRGQRNPANFYSSRSIGAIGLAGMETMYIVPPDVLARFVGKERLYFALASAGDAGPFKADLIPGPNSPYVSIRALSNRSMSRVRVLPNRQQRAAGYNGAGSVLEWAGDTATPGMVNAAPGMMQRSAAPGAPGASAMPNAAPPAASHYDDGFGPMPTAPASAPAAPAAMGLASNGLRMAPPPRARAMDGGVSAAIAIGGFLVQSVRDSAGDVTWELDQFAHIKHPNDTAPTPAEPFRDAPTIRLNEWPVAGGMVDDISAWFSIDWQFNGKSLGNIRIGNIGTNDAVGWGLHVRAQIMDDNIIYPPNQAAALRIRLHYRFNRSIGSDVIAVTDIHLFGDGNVQQSSQWLQAETLSSAASYPGGNDANQASRPQAQMPRARAMDGGVAAAIAIGGFLVQSVRDSAGDVTWELDQFAHIKHPNDTAPTPAEPFRDAPTIRLNEWPVAGGMVDDISAWFSIDWQFNGRSLGNIRIGNIGTNDAVGWGLHVRAQIMDDNIIYPPNQAAALRIRLHYRFNRSIGSDVIAVTDIHLFGDGNVQQSSQWLQAETLAMAASGYADQSLQLPAPPRPRTMVASAAPAASGASAARGRVRNARALDADGGTRFEFKYRMFIPSPLIDGPTGVFGGDGRSFSYGSGSSRGELTATVRLTPGGGIAGIDYLNRHWGESTEYNSSDASHVAGKPDWWLDKNPGAQPINRDTLVVSDDNLKLIAGVTAGMARSAEAMVDQASIISLVASGSLPLSSVAPAIDADVSLFVRVQGGQLQVKVVGEHDGFPCHELYVNQQRVYRYDPVAVGNSPTSLMPPMDIEARTGWITIGNSAAQGLATNYPGDAPANDLTLAPPPPPVARALGGPLAAAGAIAGFVAETVRDNSGGDVSWEVDQWNHIKHPNDVAPDPSPGMRNAPQIVLDGWPVAGGIADDISAWFTIDWQFNGKSLGNVRIRNAGTNDAIGWGLQVTAKVGDDNEIHQPSGSAGLFINFEYRFTRSIGSDVIAQTDIHLFGDGTFTKTSRWVQASALALEDDSINSAAARVTGRDGNVIWNLEQHPDMLAPGQLVTSNARIPGQAIVLDEWPYLDEEGGARTQLGLRIHWATDGAGAVGAVQIMPSAVLHKAGRALNVSASIAAGPQMASMASLEVLVHYRFSHPNEPDQVATTSIMLNGNGTAQQKSKWLGQGQDAARMAA